MASKAITFNDIFWNICYNILYYFKEVFLLKVLICDDDKCIVDEIKNNLNAFSDKHKIVFDIDLFYNGVELLNSNISYDMAFIDIEMPLVNGLTLSAQLKKVTLI